MVSFRSAAKQATYQARQIREDGKSASLGTMRSDIAALTRFAEFLKQEKNGCLGDYRDVNPDTAQREMINNFLVSRKIAGLTQSTLDKDRQAIQKLTGKKLPRVHAASGKEKGKKALEYRHYTKDQVEAIQSKQSPHNALATQIVYESGIRAHELLSIMPVSERAADVRNTDEQRWSKHRFDGREAGKIYTVVGKGGLVREIHISIATAQRLEAMRYKQAQTVTDRGIIYREKHYPIGGGRSWSQSISDVSNSELGWSAGGHGLRHTYVDNRTTELQIAGYRRDDATSIISQEIGHFRASVIEEHYRR